MTDAQLARGKIIERKLYVRTVVELTFIIVFLILFLTMTVPPVLVIVSCYCLRKSNFIISTVLFCTFDL